jgi:hypothetical protein
MHGAFEHDVIRLLNEYRSRLIRIEHLLEFPHLTLMQVGGSMAIGNITAGQTGQFAIAVNFPAGVTPPAGFTPLITWSSPDTLITFSPATVDLTGGTIPLSQQIIATVDASDTATSGSVGGSAIGTDGVTVLTSNVVTFTITPNVVPPTEPTLVASQVG